MIFLKNKNLVIIISSVAVLGAVGIISFFMSNSVKLVTNNSFALSTTIDQQVYGKSEKLCEAVISEANTALHAYESKMSMYVDDSEISKINSNAGTDYTKVSSSTIALLKTAKEYSRSSGGCFDITVGHVTKAWGVNSDNPRVPSDDELKALSQLVNYNDVLIDENASSVMIKKAGQAIDLGAIAKGQACNIVREIYENAGISAGLLSIGGNIMVTGNKPDGKPFTIGVRDPRGTPNEYLGTVKLTDTVLSTSGDYERFFKKDGKTYCHIMDPKTASPAVTDLMSVTVICKDGAYADCMSTVLFIYGKDKLLEVLNSGELKIIAVDKDYNVYISDNLKSEFTPNTELGKYTFHM